jgi:hypothetical protein
MGTIRALTGGKSSRYFPLTLLDVRWIITRYWDIPKPASPKRWLVTLSMCKEYFANKGEEWTYRLSSEKATRRQTGVMASASIRSSSVCSGPETSCSTEFFPFLRVFSTNSTAKPGRPSRPHHPIICAMFAGSPLPMCTTIRTRFQF